MARFGRSYIGTSQFVKAVTPTGTLTFVQIDIAVSVAVGLQRKINLFLNVPVTVAVALVRKISLFLNVPVSVAVAMLRKIGININVPTTVTVGLQRLIKLNIPIAVSVAVNATERLLFHVAIAATSTIIVFVDSIVSFFNAGSSGSKRDKKTARKKRRR